MSPPALRAIICDFNGVIADDETPHLLAFQQALREDGLTLTSEEYYGRFLGMDERNCLASILMERTGRRDPVREERIHERKAVLFRAQTARSKPVLFPGVTNFVLQAAARYRLAIATGGRREQIYVALGGTPIESTFEIVVSAEDVATGKPDPAIYRCTLDRLNATHRTAEPALHPHDCLVIEDSIAGIKAGLAAGMKVLAVATTYPAERLTDAHLVVASLKELAWDRLEGLFH